MAKKRTHTHTIATLEYENRDRKRKKLRLLGATNENNSNNKNMKRKKALHKQYKWYRNECFNAHGKRKTKSDKLTSILHIFVLPFWL